MKSIVTPQERVITTLRSIHDFIKSGDEGVRTFGAGFSLIFVVLECRRADLSNG